MTNECKIVNKGTNAGGSKTTFNGSNYEDLTRCDSEIIKLGFEKNIEFYNKDLKNSQREPSTCGRAAWRLRFRGTKRRRKRFGPHVRAFQAGLAVYPCR